MPQRDAVLVVTRGAGPDQRMEGGLQQPQTALLAGQSHAQRVRHATGTGKAGRIGPNINPRALLKTGGNLGLRSVAEMNDKADRDLIVAEMVDETAAARVVAQGPTQCVLDQAGPMMLGRDLPDLL